MKQRKYGIGRAVTLLVLLAAVWLATACSSGQSEQSMFKKCDSFTMECGAVQTVRAVTSDRVRLSADILYAKQESHKWVLMVHGVNGSRKKVREQGRTEEYLRRGYHVVVVDQRGWGNSDGDCTFGYLEHNDVMAWANAVVQADPQAEIVLHGFSMGAATILLAAGSEDLPEQVKAVVEDSGFTQSQEMYELAKENNRKCHLKIFTRILDEYPLAMDMAYTPIEAVNRIDIPVLFLHGEKDRVVPLEMCEQLYDTATCEKKMVTFQGVGHVKAVRERKNRYWYTVFEFLDQYIA